MKFKIEFTKIINIFLVISLIMVTLPVHAQAFQQLAAALNKVLPAVSTNLENRYMVINECS